MCVRIVPLIFLANIIFDIIFWQNDFFFAIFFYTTSCKFLYKSLANGQWPLRSLCIDVWLLKPTVFLGNMPEILKTFNRSQKKSGAFCANVFWCIFLSWKLLHTCDYTNLIIHLEKTYTGLYCQLCGKCFKK